jgi:hypothetical protein
VPPENKPAVDPADLGNPAHYEPHVAEGPSGQEGATPPGPLASRLRGPDGKLLTQPDLPPALIEQARQFFTDEEITQFDRSTLESAVRANLRSIIADRDRRDTQRVLEQQPRPPAPPVETEEEFPLPTEELGYDPNIVGMAKLAKKLHEENKELKKQLGGLAEREQQRNARTAGETLDLAFESLGEEWHAIFGKGDATELQGKPELRRRLAVLRDAGVDLQAVPSLAKLKSMLKAAAETIYPAQVAPKKKDDLGAYGAPAGRPTNGSRVTEEDWRQGSLARPTHRRGAAEPTGEALAVRNLERKMQQAEQQGDSDILDTLLDAPR